MSIPGAGNPLLLGGAAGGYKIERSLRFNSADSAYLSRTPASAGNRKTWTWSGWVKRGSAGLQGFFGASDAGGSFFTGLHFNSSDQLYFYTSNFTVLLTTTQVFRDYSAWYHIVLVLDTPQATNTNRLKLYVNGVQVTTFSSITYPALDSNTDLFINSNTVEHRLGSAGAYVPNGYFSGYLADIHFIDGQALTPSSFGEFDVNNVWQPKAYTGSYGTNGFHLDFSDNSTAAALGTDTSGNGNTWTVNNISIAPGNGNYISSTTGTTSPAGTSFGNMFDGNTSTFVRAAPSSTVTFTKTFTGVTTLRVYASRLGGSLRVNGIVVPNGINGTWWSIDLTSIGSTITDISFTSGPNPNLFEVYAIEVNGTVLVDNVFNSGNDSLVDSPTNYGIDTGAGGEVRGNYAIFNPLLKATNTTLSNGNLDFVSATAAGAYESAISTIGVSSGKWYAEFLVITGGNDSVAGVTWAPYNIVNGWPGGYANSIGYEAVLGKFYKDGVGGQTVNTYGVNDVIGVALDLDNAAIWFSKNGTWQGTGSPNPATNTSPAYSSLTAGTYFFAAGTGGSGKIAANFGQRPFAYTAPSGFKALCTQNLPAPTITKPSSVMDVALWTGNGSARSITGLGFNPDLVWIKGRSGATDHALYDSVRGATLDLVSNSTAAETTQTQGLTAFNSDGFSLGTLAKVNTNAATYAGWVFDAGSSTVTNTSGTISSQVRANASAGFSILTYTGATNSSTIGHGLGVAPSLIINKSRGGAGQWVIYHAALGYNYYGGFNTAAFVNNIAAWKTSPTSSVYTIGSAAEAPILNTTGETYVSYCFAPLAGYSAFGSYTGNGSADGPFVYTGFRPRWVMIKRTDTTGSWLMLDAVRDSTNVVSPYLLAESAGAEDSAGAFDWLDFTSNGFKHRNTGAWHNASGGTYVYACFAEAPFALARAR